MGEAEGGFPLAAVFRTRHGRALRPDLVEIDPNDKDTDPPGEFPPDYAQQPMGQDEEALVDATIDFDSITPLPDSLDQPVQQDMLLKATATLRDIMPLGADPVFLGELVRTLAAEQAYGSETGDEWFRDAFGEETFLTRPPSQSPIDRIEAKFYLDSLALGSGSRVLDVACGYGRITGPMSRLGASMVGLDLSEAMLRKAQERDGARDAAPDYVWGDMRQLEFDGEFDGVICTDTSFGFFSESENLLALRGMTRAVRIGGRVLVDLVSREQALRHLPGRSWWEGDGCLIQEDSDFDAENSRVRVKRLTVFSDGRQFENRISIRVYTLSELISMCDLVGLRVIETSGGAHSKGAYFAASSQRLVLTAQRVH